MHGFAPGIVSVYFNVSFGFSLFFLYSEVIRSVEPIHIPDISI